MIKRQINLTKEEAKIRIDAQMSQEQKIELADFVINNNTTLDDLRKEVNVELILFICLPDLFIVVIAVQKCVIKKIQTELFV